MGCAALAGFALVMVAATASPTSAVGGADALQGCPSECGGVHIPYPFGIGENCSRNSSRIFQINCTSGKPYMTRFYGDQYEVRDIFLSNATARFLVNTTAICSSNRTYQYLWHSFHMRLAPSSNVFTVLGKDILGIFSGYGYSFDNKSSWYFNHTVGCVSTSPSDEKTPGESVGLCNGIGCCQTSLDFPAWSYSTVLTKVDNADISSVSNVSGVCHHAFVVERGYFDSSGQKDPVQKGDIITSPLLAEWSMGIRTCEDARRNQSIYACVSRNSVCVNSTYRGYFCRCEKGYEGNPYLLNGCQDVDECAQTSGLCGDLDCVNHPGKYTCIQHIPPPTQDSSNKTILGVAIGIGGSGALLFLLAATSLWLRRWRKQARRRERQQNFCRNHKMLQNLLHKCSTEVESIIKMVNFFSLKVLKKATNNFDVSHIVGRGGHGTVYKGLIDLRVVAIKKSVIDVQNEIEGFMNEIILLSQISHRNIVKLVGCCFETEVPLLVYEFISSGTLADHLHIWNRETPLSWENRLRIATEISGALSYLHSAANISILHRDIKSSNILLDDKLTAKISDFGASKFIEMDRTHLSTNVQGTMGYLDPEYMHTGRLTEKSDVYSLGVILVELLTGEKPNSRMNSVEEGNLISRFSRAFNENRLFDVVEASISGEDHREEIVTIARLAVECLLLRGKERPDMKEVEAALEGLRRLKKQRKKLKVVDPAYDEEIEMSISYNSSSFSRSQNPTQ